jgi:hypothetical protein
MRGQCERASRCASDTSTHIVDTKWRSVVDLPSSCKSLPLTIGKMRCANAAQSASAVNAALSSVMLQPCLTPDMELGSRSSRSNRVSLHKVTIPVVLSGPLSFWSGVHPSLPPMTVLTSLSSGQSRTRAGMSSSLSPWLLLCTVSLKLHPPKEHRIAPRHTHTHTLA